MKKNIIVLFTLFLCCFISFLVFRRPRTVIEREMAEYGFKKRLDIQLYDKLSHDGAGCIDIPSSKKVINCNTMEKMKQLSSFSREYIPRAVKMLENGDYPEAREAIITWLSLSHFSTVEWFMQEKMLSFIYPKIVSLDFPQEHRKDYVSVLKKYLSPLTEQSYHNIVVNNNGQKIDNKSSLLLYCWFQVAVMNNIQENGLDASNFKKEIDILLRSVGEHDNAGIKCEKESDDAFSIILELDKSSVIFKATTESVCYKQK